jgi:hypothetical protein
VEHLHPLDRPFPWRTVAVVAGVVALVELTALIALASVRLLHVHHQPSSSTPATARVAGTPPDTATGPLRPRSRVSVLVLNGNGISGAAGTAAVQLLARGYRHALPADAPNSYSQSIVLYRPGWQAEGRRLARDAGIRAVTPLDVRLPTSDRGYQVVLILGAH